MIDDKTKRKLVKELEKTGNIYSSCLKVGINPSTFYRWRKHNKTFAKRAQQAIGTGRKNMIDIAEHALMMNIKKGKMDAIKYLLSRLSRRYIPKQRKVEIMHSRKEDEAELLREDLRRRIDEVSEMYRKATEMLTHIEEPDPDE